MQIYITFQPRDDIGNATHIDKVLRQCVENILRRRPSTYCLVQYALLRYPSMLTFQHYIADILGKVLTRPHRYSKYALPSTTGVTL